MLSVGGELISSSGGKYGETNSYKSLQRQQSHIVKIINTVVYEAFKSHREGRVDNEYKNGGT